MIAGIDFSLRSPCVCVGEKSIDFFSCHIYNYNQECKEHLKFNNVEIYPQLDYEHNIERFDHLSNFIISKLIHHRVDKVFLEDYSLGSKKGQIFQIAEATGILKYEIINNHIGLKIIAPKEIKKWYCGNGNASKLDIEHKFGEKNPLFNIRDIIKFKKIDDILDSYILYLYGVENEN